MNPTSRRNSLTPRLAAAAFVSLIASAQADLFINEVDADQTGADAGEFVEIYDGGVGNTPLDGYVLVFINGSNSQSYLSFDLDGQTTDANGFFVIGNAGITAADLTFTDNILQNGADAVGLYQIASAPANSTVMTETGLVDAVAYDTDDDDIPTLLDIAYGVSAGAARVQVNENQFATGATASIGRPTDNGAVLRDGREFIVLSTPTPGAVNNAPTGTLALNVTNASVSESAGGTATSATVTRTGSLTGDLTVQLTSSDLSELTTPTSVTILDGQATSDPFDLGAVDDLWPDGDQPVTITATAAGFGQNSTVVTVTDDPGDSYSLVVNEVYYAADASLLDANGDGTADTTRPSTDEFVEIVNVTGADINLTGYTVKENFTGSLHEFPEGTVIPAGGALVIFGGGTFMPGSTAAFGTTELQKASVPGLFLDDAGDFVQLLNDTSEEIHRVTLPDQTANPTGGSLTLTTDGAPGSGYVLHTTLPGAQPFSPGVKVNGTPFVTLTTPLAVTLNVASVVENAGSATNALTVSIPAALPADLWVRLYSSDTSELTLPDSLIIPAGQTSVSSDIFPQDDSEVDGTVSVTVTATASGYLNGSDTLDVLDDGSDVPVFTDLVINEVDSDTPGTDALEFVELYNKTSSPQSLDGLVLVFFNGSNDQSYFSINLTGTIPANGYFVVGNAAVPNVNLTFPGNTLQNGQDAVALYVGTAAGIPNNSTLAQAASAGTLVDAVVYDTNDADDTTLLAALTPGSPQINESENSAPDTESIARVPDGGAAFNTALFVTQAPTPGATNGSGGSDFDTWANSFTPAVSGGATGDDDGDGLDNSFEYAFGLNPKSGASANAFTAPLSKTTGKFSFTRRTPSLTGLTYKVFTSTTLESASWIENVGATLTVTGTSGDVETVEVTLSNPLPLTDAKLFVRVVAE
jgi:hypothetical protein